jgi:hypothetical protein
MGDNGDVIDTEATAYPGTALFRNIADTDKLFQVKVDKTMKSKKLVDELDNLLAAASREHKKHKKTLQAFFTQFQDEEQIIRRKLNKEQSKANRKKLKRELGMVHEAYDMLGAR